MFMMNQCQRLYGGAYFEDRAIRTERWKLILRRFEAESSGSRGSLYDMQADPDEWNDLYASAGHRETAADLAAQIRAWGEKQGDTLAMELGARELMG
jgi:arylsulfatase A-like enzyme